MNENINFISNKDSDRLYVVLSGISGGKDESLVKYLSDAFKGAGSVVGVQFANDPLYHHDALPEMKQLTFDDYFKRIDHALQIAKNREIYNTIIFIAHSFSSVIVSYYLGLHLSLEDSSGVRYVLVTIDSDSSREALKYLDSLSKKDFGDKTMNPFHPEIIAFMRKHDSASILTSLDMSTTSIDADEVAADHEFTSDKAKQLLVEKIISKLPAWK